MNIKKITNSVLIFTLKRLIEIFSAAIFLIGLLLLIALLSYSPDDPNFIFPENSEIKNFLGFRGSYVSDLFLQSVGYIAFLIPFTFMVTGINIFRTKEIFTIIENTFFIIIYSLVGSFFLSHYFSNSFKLYINGSGGFVGKYLDQTFLGKIIISFEDIIFYFLLFLIILFFLLSINFNYKNFFLNLKKTLMWMLGKKIKIILMKKRL